MYVSNRVLSSELRIHMSNYLLNILYIRVDLWTSELDSYFFPLADPPASSLISIDGNLIISQWLIPLNLRVILDNSFSFSHSASNLSRLWFYLKNIQDIFRIWPLFTTFMATTLDQATITFHPDYCSNFLKCVPCFALSSHRHFFLSFFFFF